MPNTVNSSRVKGNVLVLGGVNALPGTVTLKGSSSTANDGALTVEGALTARTLLLTEGIEIVGERRYVVLNLVTAAVPGQTNTFYVDEGATTHGYNVAVDVFGTPRFRLLYQGQELLRIPEGSWTAALGDFDIVRSLSTGAEGPSAVGSTNAVKLNFTPPMDAVLWYHYIRKSQAGL